MEIITGTALSNKCDYSFGDHMGAASIPRPKGGFMKEASIENKEFLEKCKEFEGRVMTVFIDNIRLYPRDLEFTNLNDAEWVGYLMANNDLLRMCSTLPNNKFIIFTSHEDTPIDHTINIPTNVLGIHAVNAEYFGGKIHPFPYGLQRELGDNDNRVTILKEELDTKIEPTKLLYINCGIERHKERSSFLNFAGLPWATTRFDKDSKYFPYDKYRMFLDELRDHKFMLCPKGHGLDCHRNWESLYMRRVPVMLDHPYFRELMKGFPVLFVDSWSEVTEELLNASEDLYQEALKLDLRKLDLDIIFSNIVQSYEGA